MELKKQRYFDKQKEQVAKLQQKKTEEQIQMQREQEAKRKQEKDLKKKREMELEAQKRRIQEYKAKKRQTEQLLANAEYIDFEDLANQTPELDADDILNSMQYPQQQQ